MTPDPDVETVVVGIPAAPIVKTGAKKIAHHTM